MGRDNLLIVQGGGPTPVVNASLCGVLKEAYHRKQKVFGARYGMEGLINGHIFDLSNLSMDQLTKLACSPGAALGSSRVKASPEGLASAEKLLRKLDLHQVIFIGGNGTMRAAHGFGQFCRTHAFETRTVGVPKTIDNDIVGTDRCPGYASAARYVAQSTRDLGMDVRSLPQPVSIFETMGRDVGWLAAASVLAKRDELDAPHLVYVPEIPFDQKRFLHDLDRILTRQNHAIVVVSEGIKDAEGRSIFETAEASQTDALNRPLPGGVARHLAQVVTRELKIRCRDEKPGLIGRASMLHASRQDLVDAEFIGTAAVRALTEGQHDKMIALTPLEGDTPGGQLVPLAEVTSDSRTLPGEWLSDEPTAVNSNFMNYARPLIGDLLSYESIIANTESYANA